MKITVSGHIGSGKTTVAKFLGEMTGYQVYSGGYFFRKMASQMGMTIEQFNKYAETDSTMDFKLNGMIEDFIRSNDNIIVESRLCGWIAYSAKIPAFKVFLDAPLGVRIKRVGARENLKELEEKVRMREDSENFRFKEYFNFDMDDRSIYDAVIDTTEGGAEYVAEKIYSLAFPDRR